MGIDDEILDRLSQEEDKRMQEYEEAHPCNSGKDNGNDRFFWVCVLIALVIFILGLCFYNDGPMIIY